MNNRNLSVVIVAILVILGLVGVYFYLNNRIDTPQETAVVLTQEEKEEKVDAYIRANIRTLSPEPEVLGGTFSASEILFTGDNSGTVLYEDGHNLFLGRFTYSIDDSGNVIITSFEAEKNPQFDSKG